MGGGIFCIGGWGLLVGLECGKWGFHEAGDGQVSVG